MKSKSEAAEASGKQSLSFQLPSPWMKEGVVTQSYMTEMMQEEKTLRSLLTSMEMWPAKDKEAVKMLERYLTLQREREKLLVADGQENQVEWMTPHLRYFKNWQKIKNSNISIK